MKKIKILALAAVIAVALFAMTSCSINTVMENFPFLEDVLNIPGENPGENPGKNPGGNTGENPGENLDDTIKYTVSFDLGGEGEIPAQTVEKGALATRPDDPVSDEKFFLGLLQDFPGTLKLL